MINIDYEIIIVGGGPAGAMASIYLANLGFNVCIIEKKIFPRETLCGEFLSKEVIESLIDVNLFDGFLSLNPNPIKSFRFVNGGGKEFSSSLNFPAFGLRRSVLDNFLLKSAKEKGVSIFQPCEVKEILYDGHFYTLIIKAENTQSKMLRAKNVVAAYGKQNNLDKSLGRKFINHQSNLNGIKFHVKKGNLPNFCSEEIKIFAGEGIYCGLNAVDDDLITICFLEKRNNHGISSREHLNKFITETESFRKIFSAGHEELFRTLPVLGTGNIFFGQKKLVENGIFMIGDAAGVIAPLAGDGIGMAFQSAKLISNILYELVKGNLTKNEAEKIYNRQWNEKFRKRLLLASIIQNIILKNILRNAGVGLINLFPQSLSLLINCTRD